MADVVYLEVAGTRLPIWDSYSVDSDMFVPADGFRFAVSLPNDSQFSERGRREQLRDKLKPGARVELFVGKESRGGQPNERTLQMTGFIDDSTVEATATNGTVIKVEGRDLAGMLVDSSIDPEMRFSVDMPLLTLVREAVKPWGIEVVSDGFDARETLRGRRLRRAGQRTVRAARSAGVPSSRWNVGLQAESDRTGIPIDTLAGADGDDASAAQARAAARASAANSLTQSDIQRLKVKDARPRIGETVWAFLERHVRRLGLMMWMSPDGKLIVSSPHYAQEPSFAAHRRFVSLGESPNNVSSGGVRQDIGERYSKVVVYGRGNVRSGARRVPKGIATDSAWPEGFGPKLLVLQDTSIRDDAAAARRALRELGLRKQQSIVLDYVLDDHGQRSGIYCIDSVCSVVDETANIAGNYYCVRRQFQRSEAGTRTIVRLVPVGSLVL